MKQYFFKLRYKERGLKNSYYCANVSKNNDNNNNNNDFAKLFSTINYRI